MALFCALVVGAVSCSSGYTLRTPADVAVLPPCRGVNGGSFVAVSDWEYRGSDSGSHYFWYYYNIDNSLRRSAVRIPGAKVVLSFTEHAVQRRGEWVTLGGKEAAAFHFTLCTKPEMGTSGFGAHK
jgi:hypothetical protein